MAKEQVSTSKAKQNSYVTSKRAKITQAEIPKLVLAEAICLPQCLYDDFAGKPTAPHQLAMALEISPTSSNWRDLCGASIAYGLTAGGYNANTISLEELGKRIVAPTEEGDDLKAKVEAVIRPKVAKEFFGKYNKAKFPQDKVARNVLAEMRVPHNRLDKVLEILKGNGEFAGIIHQTKTGPFVAVDAPLRAAEGEVPSMAERKEEIQKEEKPAEQKNTLTQISTPPTNQRVFIAHGKNKEIVSQLKDILIYGRFVPVIAEEHETTSKPVPDKVLENMRSCFAGIIHVSSEDELVDREDKVHHKINENVLIEIGAAMALYKRNFILLVQQGIHLPSNLQGLYVCYYSGEKLDGDATMRLLKAFNEFK